MCWRKMALYWMGELATVTPVEKVRAQQRIGRWAHPLSQPCTPYFTGRGEGGWKSSLGRSSFTTFLPFYAVISHIFSFLLPSLKVRVNTDSSPDILVLLYPWPSWESTILTFLWYLHLCISLGCFLTEYERIPPLPSLNIILLLH